jgi:hypothetical protein
MNKQEQYERLKAALGKRNSSNENSGFWDKFYPFYKMDFDAVAIFRFLPDLDEENPLGFVVENKYHELQINGKKKRIACSQMYGEPCACCEHSQKYYNELGDEKMGKAFWRKIDYVSQGLIQSSPFEFPIKQGENPVKLISLGPKLFKKVETAILSGDFDVPPYDLSEGYDFRIMKTRQGEYADYGNSEFARKSTPISEEMLSQIQLYNLKDFRYGKIERDQMETMIEAFLTGRSYEDDKAGEKSAAGDHSTGDTKLDEKLNEKKDAKPAAEVIAAAKGDAPAPAAAEGGGTSRAQEILARLRNRQQAQS